MPAEKTKRKRLVNGVMKNEWKEGESYPKIHNKVCITTGLSVYFIALKKPRKANNFLLTCAKKQKQKKHTPEFLLNLTPRKNSNKL